MPADESEASRIAWRCRRVTKKGKGQRHYKMLLARMAWHCRRVAKGQEPAAIYNALSSSIIKCHLHGWPGITEELRHKMEHVALTPPFVFCLLKPSEQACEAFYVSSVMTPSQEGCTITYPT
eukprot:1144434-Pelagomonas_calceolata.AAC.8